MNAMPNNLQLAYMRQLDLFAALQFRTEGLATELISACGSMPGSFWESYSAMANTWSGALISIRPSPTLLNCHD